MQKKIFLVLLYLGIAAIIIAFAIPKSSVTLYRDLQAEIVSSNNENIRVKVSGTRVHKCYPFAIRSEVLIKNTWQPATSVFTDVQGLPQTPGEQRIKIGENFVRYGKITPGGDKVKLAMYAYCPPSSFINQNIVELDAR